ncbi:MAG: glutathione transport system ATP-binding protein [Frankiaceae bacterium]|nr:glutathione transport system ATP-binding protein [Frankiaceae bacterium]
MSVLEIEGLTVSFPVTSRQRRRRLGRRAAPRRPAPPVGADVAAVRGLDLTLADGEVLGVVGESGSGKSTAALAVLGLLPHGADVSGSIRFRGRELLGLSERQLGEVRGRRIGMVMQDPLAALNPVRRVGAQLVEGLRAHDPDLGRSAAHERAVELLASVGIPNPRLRAQNYPHEFSGGMRQRVVIAMAVGSGPDVLLADEPTTALDVTVQAQVLDTLADARRAAGAAMLLITHDLGIIAGQADRVLVMYAGRPVEVGSVDTVFARPAMPYTLGLLGSSPRLDADRAARLTPIAGNPPSASERQGGCPFAPRCPLAREQCRVEEPVLRNVSSPGGDPHVAACHFSEEIAGRSPMAVFGSSQPMSEPGE